MGDPRKPYADALRNLRVDFNRPGVLAAFDDLMDKAGVPKERPPTPETPLEQEEWLALAAPLIEEFEGYAKKLPDGGVQAYPDPATGGKPWTIGIGSTTNESGQPIAPGTIWTRERAVARFKAHLAEFGEGVDKLLAGKPTTASQKAALASLAYNIGLSALSRSTVLKRHMAGDYAGAADAFAMWNKAAGKVMAGLTRRRAAEAALYRRRP